MAPPTANPTPTGKQLIYGQLLNIELMNNIPYAEVVDRINGNISGTSRYGGFIKYDKLVGEARKDPPFPRKFIEAKDGNAGGYQRNDYHQSLVTLAAEAIVYGSYRNKQTVFVTPVSTVIHDPVAQGTAGIQGLSQPFKSLAQEALKSFKNKTPDILIISAPQKGIVNSTEVISVPTLSNQLDLDNPKNLTLQKDKDDAQSNKIQVSPVEVTVTSDAQKIKKKIENFKEYGSSYFKNNPNIRYRPILELDYDQYMKNTESQREKIVKAMKKVGGVIVLHRGLYVLSQYFKSSLTALSRAMEDLVLAGDEQPLVIATFQEERLYRQGSWWPTSPNLLVWIDTLLLLKGYNVWPYNINFTKGNSNESMRALPENV